MDAFFASVEQRDHPEWRGLPIAVGGGGRRGVVAAASYEARKFGVRSAMPGFKAKLLCPQLVFVPHRFGVYKEVSQQIRAIFYEYTDLVEPLSLDEAYLDVTEPKKGKPSATLIAQEIRQRIFETTQLTASAGVSFNKFIAKIASDINKPNGQKVITPTEAAAFIEALPIEKFFGIGKVTAKKMHQMGIFSGSDLKQYSKLELSQWFGKAGRHFYKIVRAEDDRKVNPNRIRKSIGAERTFGENLVEIHQMKEKLHPIIETVYKYMHTTDNFGRTVTLKAKRADFTQITRSKSFASEIITKTDLVDIVFELLENNKQELEQIRLLGVSISNLQNEHQVEGTGIQLKFEF